MQQACFQLLFASLPFLQRAAAQKAQQFFQDVFDRVLDRQRGAIADFPVEDFVFYLYIIAISHTLKVGI